MSKILLVICLLSVASASGCSPLLAKTSQLNTSQGTPGTPPSRGLVVTQVEPESPAEGAGIHTMDLITEYGQFPVVDEAGYFAARNHYEKSLVPTVEIVVWRGVYRMTAKVKTGRLGVSTKDGDKISQAFRELMGRINAMREIPDYMLDREFKGQFKEGAGKDSRESKGSY